MHPRCVEQEGLEPYKGPQDWNDRHDLLKLHYYGKGFYVYYREITLQEVFVERYGRDGWAIFKADPLTDTVSEEHFEDLLKRVHERILHNHPRHTSRFEAFAGPQCNEDRSKPERLGYKVLFTSGTARKSGRDSQPAVAEPTTQLPAGCDVGDVDGELPPFYLRLCSECKKVRVVDVKAAAKYPLGRYTYGNRQQQVKFTCDCLVGITCSTPPDVAACTRNDKPAAWVALSAEDTGSQLPPSVICLRTLRLLNASDHTEETVVTGRYHRSDVQATEWGDRGSLLTRTSTAGKVTIGVANRRGRFQPVRGVSFTAGRLTVEGPREAKCCQPWHDPVADGIDHEDPSAVLQVRGLMVLRDLHATYDSLRRVRCIVCKQQTPGLPHGDHQVRVPERGESVNLTPGGFVHDALKKSQILKPGSKCTVTLDSAFDGANGTLLTDRDAIGVCISCSPSFMVDLSNNIVPRPVMSDMDPPAPHSPNQVENVDSDASDVDMMTECSAEECHSEDSDRVPTHVCPYSARNLVSTDVFNDEEYGCFVRSWTPAERMVLSPVHTVVTVLRSRANNVPFTKHGSICYPMKRPYQAVRLPWYDFAQMPFIVVVQHRRDGSMDEVMVNMQTIVRARWYMERLRPCPYNPEQVRHFNRLVDQQWMPFSDENMRRLQERLPETDRPCLPRGLRVLEVDEVHARADKVLHLNQFINWLESGLEAAKTLWDSYTARVSGDGENSREARMQDLWQVITQYARTHPSAEGDSSDENGSDEDDETSVTMRHVVRCAIAKHWMLSLSVDEADDGTRDNRLHQCCEELEILSREYGNDEGGATGVAAGGTAAPESERPEDIRERGLSRTALHRISMPPTDAENPLPECTPAYMQLCFPDVFRSGDGDPYQQRPINIRQPVTTWRQHWLHWMSRQPEAEGNVAFQFVVSNQLTRDCTSRDATLALNLTDFPNGLPTKEQLMNDAQLRSSVARSLLVFQKKTEDSDAYWRLQKQEMIGVVRDLEDPPSWRTGEIPLEMFMWQTRAIPYNHHPGIHRLCDGADASEALSDERYLNARFANTLRHPGIVSWMSAFIGEMDTLALAAARYDASFYIVRSEWGANANPHIHRHVLSEKFSQFLYQLQTDLEKDAKQIECEVRRVDPTLEREESRSAIETQICEAWERVKQAYIKRMAQMYTNWNAGLTKDGQRTFDFAYDRKFTVCRARMAVDIDTALSTGDFRSIDTLYVSVINGTLRHTGHSGRGTAPSRKDGCAVSRRVVDRAATESARLRNPRAAVVKKDVIRCKRRMPRRLRTVAVVTRDAHDKKIMQCELERNDVWMGGHDPFAVLHILHNIDDKGLVPAFLARAPKITWQRAEAGGFELTMELATGSGDGSVEYSLKYGLKPVAPIRTPADTLLVALETRDATDNVDAGVVKRMYNAVTTSTCQSIFQVMHKNWQLPLLQKNLDVRSFNFSGTRLLRPAAHGDAGEYVYASRLEQFDARLGDNVSHPRIGVDEIRKEMSVREFYDKFTVTEKKEGAVRRLHISRRRQHVAGKRVCIRLAPHHGKGNANPSRRGFWKYARDIVIWCQRCLRSEDLMPPRDTSEADVPIYWISKYDELMATGRDVPKWVRRYHASYRSPDGEDETDDSDNSDADEPNECDADAADDDTEREVNATRVRDRFYQTPLDAMIGNRGERTDDLVEDGQRRPERAAACIANPPGYDFQGEWLGDRVVNPTHVRANYKRLAAIGARDAAHAPVAPLAGRQCVLPALVKRYLRAQREYKRSCHQWKAYERELDAWHRQGLSQHEPERPAIADLRQRRPKALRAFLLGDPGAGKSFTLQSTVNELSDMLNNDGADWTDVVKLSAPTGCASFHMAHGATTIHRLYAIRVGQTGDDPIPPDSRRFQALCERLGKELGLLIFDEFSMIQRQMIRWVMRRLGEAGIDLDDIGVVFVGDPAQILPIGDSPVWSLRQQTDNGKPLCQASILGMAAFRELFRMPPIDTVPGYQAWRETLGQNPWDITDTVRLEVAHFRLAAFDGDYETVYLNEVRRTVEDDQLASHFTKVVIPSFRYGKATADQMQWLVDNTATQDDMASDAMWFNAVTLHGHHWFNELASYRATVESDNARALVSFAKEKGTPVMAINSANLPVKKAMNLQRLSAKEFRGVSAVFFASKGLPMMLLENIAPSVGLFNGAQVEFVGPLYLGDDLVLNISQREYESKIHLDGLTLTAPVDTPHSNREQVHQIPVGSVIVSVNGRDVDGDSRRVTEMIGTSNRVQLVVRTPRHPPHLPDFIVVQVPSYTANGGPNVLGIEHAEDLVPIPTVKRPRAARRGNRVVPEEESTEFRVGFPLEGGSAYTGFKGQGATLDRVVAKVKEWVSTPGFWTVVVSRVKHPKHLHVPAIHWPTAEDIQMQRLNDDVIEGEIFERQMRINAAKTWRHFAASESTAEWTHRENRIADAIHVEWRRTGRASVADNVSEMLEHLEPPVDTVEVNQVIEKMVITDESLIYARLIYLRQVDHRQLILRKPKRKRVSSAGAAGTSRSTSTSAQDRVRPSRSTRSTGPDSISGPDRSNTRSSTSTDRGRPARRSRGTGRSDVGRGSTSGADHITSARPNTRSTLLADGSRRASRNAGRQSTLPTDSVTRPKRTASADRGRTAKTSRHI